MEQCSVYCINTEKDAVADILERTEKRLKVAMSGTDMTIILTRQDPRQPYVGFMGGLEFETFGELE
jgi:hypothetical protein